MFDKPIPAPQLDRPTHHPSRSPVLPTPVNPAILEKFLAGYDSVAREFLVHGFTVGFSVGFEGDISSTRCNNLKSCMAHPEKVTEKIHAEMAAGRLAGPFDSPPFEPFHVSPIGLVPKREVNSFRLIHHLSHPEGKSVNDNIPKELTSVQYTSIQDAIDTIAQANDKCWLGKSDIESAFKLIPILPAQYPLFGIVWQGKYFYDKTLPMGCSISCNLFEKFSSALKWVMEQHVQQDVKIHKLLDDFLFIAGAAASYQHAINTFREVCARIGVPLAEHKTLGPVRVLPFLGITLDTVKLEARLPPDKVEKCRREIAMLEQRKRVRLR